MSNRITQRTKETYRIRPNGLGLWMGNCPQCNEEVVATTALVPQAAIVSSIKKHEQEAHRG